MKQQNLESLKLWALILGCVIGTMGGNLIAFIMVPATSIESAIGRTFFGFLGMPLVYTAFYGIRYLLSKD